MLYLCSGNVKGLSVREALKVATVGGAACLGRSEDVGRISPGYVADMVGWRTDGLAFAGKYGGWCHVSIWEEKERGSEVPGPMVCNLSHVVAGGAPLCEGYIKSVCGRQHALVDQKIWAS